MTYFSFPFHRFRRLRQQQWIRDLVQEHQLSASDLIFPMFLCEGSGIKREISSMPGVYAYSTDMALEAAIEARGAGICAVMLFPNVSNEHKDPFGQEAHNPDNLVCRTIKQIKSKVDGLGIIADVALDAYTSHGHDGVFDKNMKHIDNDATLELLKTQSMTLVKAGADGLAPSDMMDGRIAAIRELLESEGEYNTILISYAVKYASAFFSPYREAIGSKNAFKSSNLTDKKTYQMNVANGAEAILECAADVQEGADMLIVKPGMLYLDIVHRVSQEFQVPVVAYQVSGEYSMLKLAMQNGILNERAGMLEAMLSFKRAGARSIITYGALDIARMLAE